MKEPVIKQEEPVISRPLGYMEAGASAETPIDLVDDESPMVIKEEESEPSELPSSAFHNVGHDESSAILIIDDDEDGRQDPPTTVRRTPLKLGNSVLSTPARKAEGRGNEKFRRIQKCLKDGISNEGYGPLSIANPTPGPSKAPHGNGQTSFKEFKALYEAKKAEGNASLEDEMEFWGLASDEAVRAKQAEEHARYEADEADIGEGVDGEGLFVSDIGEGPSSGPITRHERGLTEEIEEELRADLNGGKKRKRKASKSAGSRKRAKKGEGKKKRNGKRRDKTPDPTNRAFDSLLTTNVFEDTAANENLPDLPTVTETRKADALKKLLASVPADQRRKALTEKKELVAASQKFSPAARADGQGGWKITGMQSSLKIYQLVGAGFMRDRERVEDKPFGGICADAMGLGKTLLMIANIVGSRPKKSIPGEPKATLIVLPATLVTQWADELKKHVSPKLKLSILTYKSGSRPETHDTVDTLGHFDVVLTTYHEVRQSYPKAEIPIDLQTAEEKNDWWRRHFEDNKGDLHRVEWKRVVLDEAQQIKNFKSATSLSCRALNSKLRWALSGTPILNSPLELYAYFKFLQVPFTGSFRVFKANYYATNSHEPGERLSIMVNRFMIRRTHKDTMFGAPILKLPKASERVHWVKFNDLERGIYEIVRRRMVARVNSFAKENTLQRNYRNVLTMLLRLRQMTGNVLLVEVVMKDLLEREDHEKIRELAQLELRGDESRRNQLVHLRKMLLKMPEDQDPTDQPKDESTPAVRPDEGAASDLDNVPDEQVGIGGAHGLTFNFGKYLRDLRRGKKWDELQERTLCVVCREPPEQPYVTACYHIYCGECLEENQRKSALEGHARSRCRQCLMEYIWAHPCDQFDLDSIMSDVEEGEVNATAAPTSRWRKKANENKAIRTWIETGNTILPSAKTIAVKAQILNWLEKDPNCKILVYTQFISMIHILKKICEMENWSFLEYSGQLNIASRDRALENFKKNNTSILLASLKCGGLGLNLTAAKHVISIDPWWNSAIEQQAFCRVFRIGQTEETSMTRFVVEGTIDESMISMQDRKKKEIDQVMGDSGTQRENLSVQEMMRLFGPVSEDGEGRPFIMVEEKETLPRFNADSEDEGDED
ncbi:hypothetical protein SLS56_002682 [Neofusicoccum ribis]|uniref:Uncharacterized protein n=1 Tax=Neofusicoccum ribis TaxID=45134 RepID=A0ABR3T2L7_9PEZI